MPRLIVRERSSDFIAYVQGQTQKWAPGDSRVGAVTELVRRYLELAYSPCSLCGRPFGTENIAVDDEGELIHLLCYHAQNVEPLR